MRAKLFLALIIFSSLFLNSCFFSTMFETTEVFTQQVVSNSFTPIKASIQTRKDDNSIYINITPNKNEYEPFAYTLFEVNEGKSSEDTLFKENEYEINEIKCIKVEKEQLFKVNDGKLSINPLKSAEFKVDATKGVFYIAVEVNNGSYLDDTGVNIFSKTLYTDFIVVKK